MRYILYIIVVFFKRKLFLSFAELAPVWAQGIGTAFWSFFLLLAVNNWSFTLSFNVAGQSTRHEV